MPEWLPIEAPKRKEPKPVKPLPMPDVQVAVGPEAVASHVVVPGKDNSIGSVDASSKAVKAATPRIPRDRMAMRPPPPPEPPKLDPANPYSMGVEKLIWEYDAQGNRIGGHWEPMTDEEYLKR